MAPSPWQEASIAEHSRRLAASFRHWTGESLIPGGRNPDALARELYRAPFVLVSHGIEPDPLFNYANLQAQALWELGWDALVGMPSRRTAESPAQDDRSRALAAALKDGFVRGYRGVRISASGRRFRIEDGIIWNVVDADGARLGQAATFARWIFL